MFIPKGPIKKRNLSLTDSLKSLWLVHRIQCFPFLLKVKASLGEIQKVGLNDKLENGIRVAHIKSKSTSQLVWVTSHPHE